MDSFTVNINDKEHEFKVCKISSEIRNKSQAVYSAALQREINNGAPVKAQIDKLLRKRGLLNDEEQEAQAEAVRKKLREMEIKLFSARNPDGSRMTREQGRELAMEMRKERRKVSNIGESINDLYSNTAEQVAQNEQLQYFIYACTLNAGNGKRYWNSYEEFLNDDESPVLGPATDNLLLMLSGVDKDYAKKFPENSWLIRRGYMNDKLQLVNPDGRLIDEEGRFINENGRFVNEAGEFVDQYGYRVDEDGKLLVEDGWEDES